MLFLLKGVWGFPQLGLICRQTNSNLAPIHKQSIPQKISLTEISHFCLSLNSLRALAYTHCTFLPMVELSRVGLSFTHEHFSLQKYTIQGCVIGVRFATKRAFFLIGTVSDFGFFLDRFYRVMVKEGKGRRQRWALTALYSLVNTYHRYKGASRSLHRFSNQSPMLGQVVHSSQRR